MSALTYALGGKTVLLHEPYEPRDDARDDFVGRTDELRLMFTGVARSAGETTVCPLLMATLASARHGSPIKRRG